MTWITVKYLPLDQDLRQLTQFLSARGLAYRVSEENSQQVLSVEDPALVEPLTELVEQFLRGNLELPEHKPQQQMRDPTLPLSATPVTFGLILLSVLGALFGSTEEGQAWAVRFTFQAVDEQYRFVSLSDTLAAGEFWRLLTPAFLHFGFFHILFNSLWLWDLGRRLELSLGGIHYMLFFVITAVAANVAQYWWSGAALFGGMSGFVYALVGFIWLRQRLVPHPLLAVPPGIIGFMLFWLVLCMTGVVDYFIGGSIANAAHLGGLIAGIILGVVSGLNAKGAAKD